ncbi:MULTISPECIES: hypothetical protein [Sphingobacterium]|uniref:hypothetical protein n=1 Tax=Sphingobacterium TaxID=28453 RepID=UPI0013DBB302|nr:MULTISPECIES: hypothetical protein [unclassified Sphingobacterium]
MFNLFKKNNPFPRETTPGNIYISDNRLFYEDHTYEESVDLSILKYAYVEILAEAPYLFLFDYRQHYIPALQQGFSKAYLQLSKRFGFDDALFFKTINSKKEQKNRIWIGNKTANYQILPEQHTDYEDGFEIQSTPLLFVSWDTTYEEFLKLNIGQLYQSEFDTTYFKINYPVRIGSLLIDLLEFYYDADERQNIAIQSYFTTLYTGSNSDESYYQLRELWMEEIPTVIDNAGYERDDQKYLTFDLDGIGLSICYTYDVDGQYDDGGTSLTINNYRDYSESVLTDNLALSIETTQILSFDTLLNFQPDYKSNANVIAIPLIVVEKTETRNAVWLADDNTFGFTGDQYAIQFNRKDVHQLIIQNVLPAKGGGYVELSVKLKSNGYITIYYGEQHALDTYVQQLQEFLGIEVEVPEPYYNC